MSVLLHVLGLDNPAGRWGVWWSGFGADLGEFALILGVPTFIRRHNCHVKRCHRIGRFPVGGTVWTVCHRHHPDGAPSAEDVRRTS